MIRSLNTTRTLLIAAVVAVTSVSADTTKEKSVTDSKFEKAVFGGGCFWCTEAIFEGYKGVKSVVSGYAGGHVDNPQYRAVCEGTTGHAEVIEITFDPKKVDFADLVEVFMDTHDPTTLNRQGNDRGTQYRSVIFYQNEEQKEVATAYIKQLNDAKTFKNPIVTEVTAAPKFWPAEDYHQDYFARNPEKGYCQVVIRPKVEKFRRKQFEKKKKQ